ncbi:rhodanese-like domain-containing protein [Sanguibacter antarcticus]|uniref:Rhodanese-related sulfurtransferase n=1 Tax=Sanguibacter antarcticus TaxID=372484 RepID=A0A2A9E4R9_9MICO|nr:rhodanese-like domain-containing protein [Sanguibacter antarcticus]PFG33232.1 rhodanese-related sulfurtransferase [Sanguibacter antarcticus]
MFRTMSAVGALALALTLSSCADAEQVTVPDDAIIIDVRTPAEYAEGHLEGAQLLDLTGGELAAAIPTLDQDAEYFVYCKSGNRSGQATQLMTDAGITDITDLGSMTDAAEATQIDVVR